VSYLSENALHIYTDGSQINRPRRQGGVGFVFVGVDSEGRPDTREVAPPGWKGATNNQMELQACVEALRIATGNHCPVSLDGLNKVVVHSDSQYLVDNYPKAVHEWSRSKWRTRDGSPVRNLPQWKEIVTLARRLDRMNMRLEFDWVKGHAGDPYNEAADDLADASARAMSDRVLRPARVRRKLSPLKCKPGCVTLQGQVETIRVVTDEYLRPPHDCYAVMYEIVDDASADFQLVDKATSDELLSAGHTYKVRLSEGQSNPRVVEVIEELVQPDESNGGDDS
jgi:ribonuclease HI